MAAIWFMKAFAPLPAAAESVTTLLRLPDGACVLRAIPAAQLAAMDATLAEDAARLPRLAARLMEDAAVARFAAAREQVPAYGAWAYGWVQSYITSYRVLWHLGKGLGTAAEGGPLLDRVSAEIAEPMRDAFRTRVLAPTSAGGGLPADLDHVARVVDTAWGGALAAVARLAEAPAAPAGSRPGRYLDLAGAAAPLAGALAGLAPADPLALLEGDGVEPPAIFLRSMRPMAARLGAVAVRASEAGSILAASGGFGFALGGIPGVALGMVGGVGLSWGIDLLFNRVDAALNQADFEAQALAALGSAEARLVRGAEASVATALASRQAALRGAASPCG